MKKSITTKSEKLTFLKSVLSGERLLRDIMQTNIFITFSSDCTNPDLVTRHDTGEIITRKEAEAICRELKKDENNNMHWVEWKSYDAAGC
jgi:hypothetical protein